MSVAVRDSIQRAGLRTPPRSGRTELDNGQGAEREPLIAAPTEPGPATTAAGDGAQAAPYGYKLRGVRPGY
jgi:hypothetical protein